MGRRFSGNAVGGVGAVAPRAFAAGQIVPLQSGQVAAVGPLGLLAPVVFGKSGGNANLSINSASGGVIAASSLTGGGTQALNGTITGADGVVIPFALTLTGAVSVPAAPTLSLAAANGQVSIGWTDGTANGSAITAHKLYRGIVAGGGTLLGSIATGTPFLDTGLVNGTTYYYQVSAVNAVGEGARSAEQSATPMAIGTSLALSDIARPPLALTRFANIWGSSNIVGVGTYTGKDPVSQLRALITTTVTGPFHGGGASQNTASANKVGMGGVGGDDSGQILTRMQAQATNFAAELPRPTIIELGAQRLQHRRAELYPRLG